MEISVVVSAFNNREVLRTTLAHLADQSLPREAYEVIVADDGSTDGPAEMVRSLPFPTSLRYVAHAHAGASAVRNLGAREARSRIVRFLDADFWAEPGLLSAHHAHYPPGASGVAVQGATVVHPDSLTTPFMQAKVMDPDLTLRGRRKLSPYHVVSRNVSLLKADVDASGGFDDGFPGYGDEDLDLALRLTAAGVVFAYEPDARAHTITWRPSRGYGGSSTSAGCARCTSGGNTAVRAHSGCFWRSNRGCSPSSGSCTGPRW